MKRKLLIALSVVAGLGLSNPVAAAEYLIDSAGSHASINFRIIHLGFSWLTGRFDTFSGAFNFEEGNPGNSTITVKIDTASVNSNHGKRDNHLRSADFLDVASFPTATFVSTSASTTGERTGIVKGNLTLHGVTREIAIDVEYIGGGNDPWGNFRQGFAGTTSFALADFGIDYDLGPASRIVEMSLHVEGIRQ